MLLLTTTDNNNSSNSPSKCKPISPPIRKMAMLSRPNMKKRTRFFVCLTILISASLVVFVFLGPLFISSFPSLSDRADILIHKETPEIINQNNQQRYKNLDGNIDININDNGVDFYQNVPDYAPVFTKPAQPEFGTSTQRTESLPQSSSSSSAQSEEQGSSHSYSLTDASLLSAAEKLECPAHVVSFVVNATDVKDECDGLRKAFDQTCGGTTRNKKGDTRRRLSQVDRPGVKVGDTFHNHDDVTGIHNNMIVNALTWRPIREYVHGKLNMLKGINRKTESSYGKRRLILIDGKDDHDSFPNVKNTNDERYMEATNEKANQHATKFEEKNKPLSPSLPTTNSEVADHMVNDALSLNADLKDIAKAIEDIHNHTSIAQEPEHPSKVSSRSPDHHYVSTSEDVSAAEELKSTAVAVSAIINNPEAIETQACCKSILTVFHEECDSPEEEEFNDKRLFVIVCVIALCGMVKSLIRHFKIRWLPEAGGCIIVGMIGGMFLRFLPSMDFGFQHDMFLRLMVPPIIFEAALNINKKSFSQMAVPIVVFAIWGTFMSTVLTAAIVYYGSGWFSMCTSIPFIESLAYGALISSIDPIAVLSVLSNMGMSDKDPIYILIFGESLLNDGVAIVLFQTLVHFMDSRIVIDGEACWLATLHFLVIAFGSLFVGLTCGVAATVYFWLMKGIQTPLVEVLMFLCWAFIPYYICDGVDWSGIVSIVAAGFFMDVYVIGSRMELKAIDASGASLYPENGHTNMVTSRKRTGVFSQEGFLSTKAKNHIGFVTEINSTLMETAIFAYLGIFLFNKRYHWSLLIVIIGIFSCIASRSLTVVFSSGVSNMIAKIGKFSKKKIQSTCATPSISNNSSPASKEIDTRMQLVLIFAGLRGAMSFALVETVPMYDPDTGEGSRYKPELKAMTSASIMFTLFILGGCTYYLLENIGMGPVGKDDTNNAVEMVSLIDSENVEDDENPWGGGIHKRPNCPLSDSDQVI